MSAEKLRKFIKDNQNLFGWEDTLLLNGICNTLNDYEQQGCKVTVTGSVIAGDQAKTPETNVSDTQKTRDEAIEIVDKCFRSAWHVAFSRTDTEDQSYTTAVKLTEIMMDYIKHKQRINATSNIADLAKEYLKPKPENIPFPESVYKQHEEKLINSDDFLNEMPFETLDITKSSVGMLQKRLIDESGGAISMEVLCHDEMGNLKKVTSIQQVLFRREQLGKDRFVFRIIKEVNPGDPITQCALLIS